MSSRTAFDVVTRAAEEEAAQAAFHKSAIESWTLYSIGVAATILRTYARGNAVGLRNLRADDYLVWVGIVRVPDRSQPPTTLLTRILEVVLHRADSSCIQRGQCCPWPSQ